MSAAHRNTASKHLAGFTLIEVLVVMVLLALIGGVLFQALERAYRLQERFGTTLFSVQQGQMASDWYRQSVQGLYPDHPNGAGIFQGKPQEFSGLSTNPLNADYGIPTLITWRLRVEPGNNSSELVYVDKGQETSILNWRGNAARFVYLDDKQVPHNTWPPSLGQFAQLPTQIHVETPKTTEIFPLLASPMGPTTPPLRLKDILGLPQ